MNFRCSNCGHDHRGQQSSILVNPNTGTLLVLPWFRDERGMNHQATTCLKCGTVHGTHGAPLKALFTLGSRMVSVKFFMTPSKLQELIDGKVPKMPFAGLDLNPMIVEELEKRGFIQLS